MSVTIVDLLFQYVKPNQHLSVAIRSKIIVFNRHPCPFESNIQTHDLFLVVIHYQPFRPSIQVAPRSPTRVSSNGDSSTYATLRKPPVSPKGSFNKPKLTSYASPAGTSSFRLPPPLSSTMNNNNSSELDSLSSSRTRSLENINSTEKPHTSSSIQIESNSSFTNGNSSNYNQRPTKPTNLQSLGDANLSSSTESTNNIPFANENVGTIKQRSPHNQGNNLYNSSFDSMKRSLPMQFIEQSNTHLLKPSYPMTTAIYDNNDRYIPNNVNSRKSATLTGEKRLQYIEIMKKDQQNKVVR